MSLPEQLLAQCNDPNVPRSTAFANVHNFLLQHTCWWCSHYELANCLLEVLPHQHSQAAQQIWDRMSQQMAACAECINGYHTAQQELFQDFQHTSRLLGVLQQLDKQRLLSWVAAAQQQPADAGVGAADAAALGTTQLHALFELLGYAAYLDDAALCAATVALLDQVAWDIELSDSTPTTGLFRLLAHPDAGVRSKALAAVKPLGPLSDMDAAAPTLSELWDCWMTALQEQQQQPQAGQQLSQAAQHQLLVEQGQLQQWPRPCVWSALKAVMGMLQGDCMGDAIELYPSILPVVLAQATPGAYAARGVAGVAAPSGLSLAPEGSLEQKHALGCLHSMLLGLRHMLWCLSTATVQPRQLVQHLQGSVWGAVGRRDEALLRLLVSVLQALAQALLPCLEESEIVELLQESDGEWDQAGPATPGFAGEGRHAALVCLQLLLVQLAGSASVPSLIRGLALEAGLAVCLSALQSPRCPGTAALAHLWTPVCAAVLLVPQEQYSSLQGQTLPQHSVPQAPGILQLLPVLRQMASLQERVTEAAAGLVATALQADAAVLHASLSKRPSGTAANKAWLLPSALDVVEVSLSNSLAYKCAPGMWLALAGCGHAVVSASFVAAAAQLVPLTAAAAAGASQVNMQQQQLDASLQLPNPDTLDLLSSAHAVLVLESAGWLHQQFTRAAVHHMHTCSCRSRLFLLPPEPSARLKGQAGQTRIDAVFRQMSASSSPPPDSTAAAAYALAVQGCCTLMMQGRSGAAAVLASGAQNALLSSCGVPLSSVQQAVQQHLLAPGSVCAESVIQALQLELELQQLLEHGKIARALLRAPEQLSSFFELSGFTLAAAVSHGLELMLPLFASYLPGLWQASVSVLSTGCKVVTSSMACAACASTAAQQAANLQQHAAHTGPGVGSVLLALLDALPAMWQCHQALITQHCQQRQLYLEAADDDSSDLLLGLSPLAPDMTPSQGSAGATAAVAAALHRESAWLEHLLALGRCLHAADGPGGCACIKAAAADRRLRLAWRACLEDVVKATRSSLPKGVRSAATELMQSSNNSLDKLWLAQVFPSAAPGNLASSGLGGWPSRLGTAAAAPAPVRQAAVKAEPGAAPAAAPAAAAAAGAGPARQPSINLDDYDVVDLLGEWSEGSEDAAERAAGSDDDVIVIDSEDEPEQQEQFHASQQQQQHDRQQAWPWLRKQAAQQQSQQQQHSQAQLQQAGAEPDLLQKQQQVQMAVSRLLQSSKALYPSTEQKQSRQEQGGQQQQQRTAAGQLPAAAGSRDRSSAAAAAAGDGRADDSSAHLLRFKVPSKAAAAAAAAGADAAPAAAGKVKRVKRPDSSSMPGSATAATHQAQQQQQQGAGGPQGMLPWDEDEGEEELWPEEWRDIKGAHAPEQYPVYRYNRPPLRPRKPATPGEGLSKGEQVRMELLGRAAAAEEGSQDEAALAAELVARAGVSHRRLPAAAPGRQPAGQQHQQQHKARDSSRPAAGRPEGLSAAGRAAVHRAAAQLVHQQQQRQESELRLERWQQRQQEEQQQAAIRQQLAAAREERRKQAEAARSAEPAAEQGNQQAAGAGSAAAGAASSRAGIALVSDDALFKQAAAAAAAGRPARTVMRVRHQGPLFLRPSRPTAMGLAGTRAPAPGRQYPVLRLEDVWAELLSWGYQGAVGSGSGAAAAASGAATRKLLEEGRVPLRFTSVGHYCAVFRGLLLEELRAGLAAAHEEHVSGSTSSGSGSGRGGSSFRCLPITVDSVQRQSKVYVVVARVDTSQLAGWERDGPRGEDFVVVTRLPLSGPDLSADWLPRSHLSGLVVEASTLQPGLRQVTLHVVPASAGSEVIANFMRERLVPGAQLYVSVITSLKPNFREFQALIALQHAPAGDRLLKHVLYPEPPKVSAAAAAGGEPDLQQLTLLPTGLSQALQAAYNSSQCAAVVACLDKRYPFVLVQGPPGTGKTSAIVGMLSALLGAAERGGGRSQGAAARQGKALAAGGSSSLPARSALQLGVVPPVRVLVCAQSNAAIDELIIRLANSGVWSGSGARRAPAMVRMGRSDAMHPSVLTFHVDALADTAVQQQAQQRAEEAAAAKALGQQQLQLHQQGGKPGDATAAAAGAAGAGAGAAAGAAPSPLERRLQELREQLHRVEQQLADLAKQEAAGEVAAAPNKGAGTLQGPAVASSTAQQQQGLGGQKRSSTADVGAGSAGMPPPPNKLPRAVAQADVAAANAAAAAAAEAAGSGSDMEVSDGEGAAGPADSAAHLHRNRQDRHQPHAAASKPHSRHSRGRSRGRSASPGERGGSSRSRHRSSDRNTRRSKSPEQRHSRDSKRRRSPSDSRSPGRRHGGSGSSREHRSSGGHVRGRSRSRSRGRGRSRSLSRSGRQRSRRSTSRGRRGSPRERTDRNDGGWSRSSRDSKQQRRSKSRSRSRDRGRGSGSSRADDRQASVPDSRGSSDAAGDRHSRHGRGTGGEGSSREGDRHRSCRSTRDGNKAADSDRQGQHSSRSAAASAGSSGGTARGDRRDGCRSHGSYGTAGAEAVRPDGAGSRDKAAGRDGGSLVGRPAASEAGAAELGPAGDPGGGGQQPAAAAAAALLRDQQRSLAAELRRLEREQQQAQAGPPTLDRRGLDKARKEARQAVILAAEVVLCTLSASGGDLLNAFPAGGAPLFDVVVVDEAAQALEPATLIPLQLIKPGSGRVVLVGDPCQLPPTVLSKAAEASLLAQSLFERLAKAGWPVQLLQEQYRSHPAISAFPSKFFYQSKLLDGAGVDAVSKGAPFHSKLAFGPLVVWDCQEGRESSGGRGGSMQNPGEAELAATLVAGLLAEHRASVGSIAVISPYRAQVACLRSAFRAQLGDDPGLAAANIEFGTVDGFQGREADVVVFSCVRAQPGAAASAAAALAGHGGSGAGGAGGPGGPRIGFLQDVRRMNVGLTRGRRAVWVVCHADTLSASPVWLPLLRDARARGVLLTARRPFRRLLTAGDRQLRGSYFLPPAAAVEAPPAPSQGAEAAGAAVAAAAAATGQLAAHAGSAPAAPALPAAGPGAAATSQPAAAAAGLDRQGSKAARVKQPAAAAAAAEPPQRSQPDTAAAGAAPAAKQQVRGAGAGVGAGSSAAAGGAGASGGGGDGARRGQQAAAAAQQVAAKRPQGPRPGAAGGPNKGSAAAGSGAAPVRKGTAGAAATAAAGAGAQAKPQQPRKQPGMAPEEAAWAAAQAARAAAAAAAARGSSKSGSSSRRPAAAPPMQPLARAPGSGGVEAAAWAAADAARAAAGAAAGSKPKASRSRAAAAAGNKGADTQLLTALEKRLQQQQQQAGRSGQGAAAAEGRPVTDAANSAVRRRVVRPGQQTPAAVMQQPQQRQQQRAGTGAVGGAQQRLAGKGAEVAARGAQHAAGGRPAAQQQRQPQQRQQQQRQQQQQQPTSQELKARLLARLSKQGPK